jgi:hypothetical protein
LGCGNKTQYSPSGKGHFGTSPLGHLGEKTSGTPGVVGSCTVTYGDGVKFELSALHPALYA